MSSLNLRLPNSLHKQVRELARREEVSMNQFIVLAVAEKVSALLTVDYLTERGQRGSKEEFERVLEKIASTDRDPLPEDRLEDQIGLTSNTSPVNALEAHPPDTKAELSIRENDDE
jgi:hypothetical protein